MLSLTNSIAILSVQRVTRSYSSRTITNCLKLALVGTKRLRAQMATEISRPQFQVINGVRFPVVFSPKNIMDAFEYKPRPDDVIIDTYPKCGTTWMQMVVIEIFRKGQPLDKPTDFGEASPFLEAVGLEMVSKMPRPGPIKTHLPYDVMPYSPDAKYIFVIRNPMDTCVSLYHHTNNSPAVGFWRGDFNEFFEYFMAGEVEYDNYFDHLLSWYPHRNDRNVYYTTYENMKKDLRSVVLEVAKFLGEDYLEPILKENDVMNRILLHTDFPYMKAMFSEIEAARKRRGPPPGMAERLKNHCDHSCDQSSPKNVQKSEHIRKGIVGGWRDYFSKEQYLRLKEKFMIRTAGTDISSLWPDLFED